MIRRAGGCSDRGPVRRTNEDALFEDEAFGLLSVADGMGGHAAGEVASRLAVDAVVGFLRRTSDDHEHSWPDGLDSALSLTSNRVRTAVSFANRRVDDKRTQEIPARHESVDPTADALVRAALDQGCRDNVTVLVAECDDQAPP
jgi:serine/threonine protein phosphatase PrpC